MHLGKCIGNKCLLGEVLKKEKRLHSENRKYSIVLRNSGNLEIFCGRVLIWASNTYDSRIDGLYFKHDAYKSMVISCGVGRIYLYQKMDIIRERLPDLITNITE